MGIFRLLTLALMTFSLQVAAESAADYFEAAIARFDNKEYRASAILLKNALREDPQHLPSRILLGKSLIHVGDVESAEKDLKIALEYGADESQVVTLLGSAYLVQGKYKQLLAEIRSGGRATDVEIQILVLRAYAHLQLGDLKQAKKNLERARRLQPDHAGPMLALSTIAIRQGKLEEAEQLINLAQKHEPDPAEILFARGELARLRGETTSAIEYYDQSLEQNPGKVQARMSRAALLMSQGNDQTARKDVDYLLKQSPNNLQVVYLNAMLLARKGDYQQASSALQEISQTLSRVSPHFLNSHGPTILLMGTLDYLQNKLESAKSRFRRYIKLEPNHLQPRLLMAETLIRLKDYVGATLVLRPMLEQHPDNVDVLLLAGTALLHEERYEEASGYLERAADLKPNLANVRTRLALSNLGQGHTQAAMQDLSRVMELSGGQIGPGILLASMQLRQQAYDKALQTLAMLRKKAPDNPILSNWMGLAYLGKNDTESARSAFTIALELAPDFSPAHLNLAAVEAGTGNFSAAGEQFNKVLRLHPGDVRAMEGMAKIAELSRRPQDAISWLEKIRNLETESASTSVLQRLAELYLRARRPQQAIDVADELGQRHPGELTELDLKGRAHLQLNEHKRAARLFRIMHQSKPESAATLQRIAALLMQAGDLQNAQKAIEEALLKAPDLIPARGTRILIEQRLGNLDGALTLARKLQQDHPKLSIGQRLLGDILAQQGKHQAAAQAYAAAQEIEPDTQLLLMQFRAERAAGKGAQATALLNQWLQSHPEDIQVHAILAAIYNRSGALENARTHYEKLAELQPENAGTLNNLAVLYQRMNRPDAIEMAKRALELSPNDAAANDTLGWILVQQGQPQEGLGYLRQAQARAGRNPEVRYHLATALHALGRTPEAARELRAALNDGTPFKARQEAQKLLVLLDKN